MTKIIIRELVFDEYNREHIKKHNVTEIEIVEAGKRLIYHRKTYKGRYLAIGRTDVRLITLIIQREGTGRYFLITARDTSKKERRDVYEKEKKQNS